VFRTPDRIRLFRQRVNHGYANPLREVHNAGPVARNAARRRLSILPSIAPIQNDSGRVGRCRRLPQFSPERPQFRPVTPENIIQFLNTDI